MAVCKFYCQIANLVYKLTTTSLLFFSQEMHCYLEIFSRRRILFEDWRKKIHIDTQNLNCINKCVEEDDAGCFIF